MTTALRIVRRCARAGAEALVPVSIVVLVIVAWQSEPARGFNNPDDIRYALMARMWEGGALPYRDAVDHKPPVIYVFHRVCFAVGGATPRALWQGYTLLTLVPSLLVYAALRLTRRPGAAAFAALAMIYMGLCKPLDIDTVNTERLVFYWAVVAFALATLLPLGWNRVLACLSGAAFALAFWAKQPGLWMAVPLLASMVTFGRQNRSSHSLTAPAWFGAGFGLVGLGWVTYFTACGGLYPFLDWVFLRNFGYAGFTEFDLARRRDVFVMAYENLRPLALSPEGMPVSAILAGLFLVLLVRPSPLAVAAVVWLVSGMLAACTGLGMDPHYLVFLFPGVLVAAAAVGAWLFDEDGTEGGSRPCIVIAKGLLLASLSFAAPMFSRLAASPPEPEGIRHVAAGGDIAKTVQRVAAMRCGSDRIQILGGREDLAFFAGLTPATRWIYLPTGSLWKRDEDLGRRLLAEAAAAAPAFVLVGLDIYEGIRGPNPEGYCLGAKQLLDSAYVEVLNENGVYLYRRRELVEQGCPALASGRPVSR